MITPETLNLKLGALTILTVTQIKYSTNFKQLFI